MRTPGRLSSIFLLLLLASRMPAAAQSIQFRDVTREAGLIEPLAGLMGHGGAWGDFDGDGQIDIFAGGFCDRPDADYAPAPGPVPNRLLRNLGNGRFAVVRSPPVAEWGRASGAVFADLDNNGTLELYIANNARFKSRRGLGAPQLAAKKRHAQLLRNDSGQLVDISALSGACPDTLFTARNVGVFDFNGDGLLDLFVVEDRFTPSPRSTLFRNLGGLKFKDANQESGLPDDIFGFGLAVADLNGDGRPDFFVGHSNRLFLSQSDGRYREAVELRHVFEWQPLHGEDWPCGAAFGDLNRDGLLDLVLSIHSVIARNKVFLNEGLASGVPRFRDVTNAVGLGDPVPARCPHVEIQDFDNDGWPDIYLSAAWLEDDEVTPLIYRNTGTRGGLPRFTPPRKIVKPMVYFPAGPTGDYDNDGRLDLFLINWFAGNHSRLLQNDSAPRRWLNVQVLGRQMNRMGIGAQVKVFAGGQLGRPGALLGYQEVTTGYGYASGQPAVCHFGLGDETTVDVEVKLPDGTVLKRLAVESNQFLIVKE